jgi:uncharacterized protein YPO0396
MNYKQEKKIIAKKLNRMHDNLRDRDFLKTNGCFYLCEIEQRKATDMKVIRELIYDLRILNRKIEMGEENESR